MPFFVAYFRVKESEEHRLKACPLCLSTFEDGVRFCPFHGTELKLVASQDVRVGDAINGYKILYRLSDDALGAVCVAQNKGSIYRFRVFAPALMCDMGRRTRLLETIDIAKSFDGGAVPVMDSGYDDQKRLYCAQPFVPGVSLQDIVNSRIELSEEQCSEILMQILRALRDIHSKRIIHGCLRLSHIIIDNGGKIFIHDAGYWDVLRDENYEDLRLDHPELFERFIDFMAPEVVEGFAPQMHSDVFSAAAAAYTLLALRPPAEPGDIATRIYNRIYGRWPKLREVCSQNISDDFIEILDAAMTPDSQMRFQAPRAYMTALASIQTNISASDDALRPAFAQKLLRLASSANQAMMASQRTLAPMPLKFDDDEHEASCDRIEHTQTGSNAHEEHEENTVVERTRWDSLDALIGENLPTSPDVMRFESAVTLQMDPVEAMPTTEIPAAENKAPVFDGFFETSTDFFSDFGKDLENLFREQDEQAEREAREQAEREAREQADQQIENEVRHAFRQYQALQTDQNAAEASQTTSEALPFSDALLKSEAQQQPGAKKKKKKDRKTASDKEENQTSYDVPDIVQITQVSEVSTVSSGELLNDVSEPPLLNVTTTRENANADAGKLKKVLQELQNLQPEQEHGTHVSEGEGSGQDAHASETSSTNVKASQEDTSEATRQNPSPHQRISKKQTPEEESEHALKRGDVLVMEAGDPKTSRETVRLRKRSSRGDCVPKGAIVEAEVEVKAMVNHDDMPEFSHLPGMTATAGFIHDDSNDDAAVDIPLDEKGCVSGDNLNALVAASLDAPQTRKDHLAISNERESEDDWFGSKNTRPTKKSKQALYAVIAILFLCVLVFFAIAVKVVQRSSGTSSETDHLAEKLSLFHDSLQKQSPEGRQLATKLLTELRSSRIEQTTLAQCNEDYIKAFSKQAHALSALAVKSDDIPELPFGIYANAKIDESINHCVNLSVNVHLGANTDYDEALEAAKAECEQKRAEISDAVHQEAVENAPHTLTQLQSALKTWHEIQSICADVEKYGRDKTGTVKDLANAYRSELPKLQMRTNELEAWMKAQGIEEEKQPDAGQKSNTAATEPEVDQDAQAAEEARQAQAAEEARQAQAAEEAKKAQAAEEARQAQAAEEAKKAQAAEEAKKAQLEAQAAQTNTSPKAEVSTSKLIADAQTALSRKDFETAITLLKQATAQEPKNHRAWFVMARAYDAQNNTAKAVESAKKAFELSKQSSYQLFLGDMLVKIGDKAGARTAYEVAKSLGANAASVDAKLNAL